MISPGLTPEMQCWFSTQRSIIIIQHIEKLRKKHKITLQSCRKAFTKIQHPFLIKTLSKLGAAGNVLNLIKGIYE